MDPVVDFPGLTGYCQVVSFLFPALAVLNKLVTPDVLVRFLLGWGCPDRCRYSTDLGQDVFRCLPEPRVPFRVDDPNPGVRLSVV